MKRRASVAAERVLLGLLWASAPAAAGELLPGVVRAPLAVVEAPRPAAEWISQARELERRADWTGLFDWSLRWTAAAPRDATAWFVRGRALEGLRRGDEGAEAYREAIRLDPDDVHARNNLGNLYRARARHRDAMLAYRDAVERDPDYLQGWHNLGLSFYLLKGQGGVSQALSVLRKTDPQLADAWQLLARDYAVSRDPRVAERAHAILRATTPAQRERMFAILLAGV